MTVEPLARIEKQDAGLETPEKVRRGSGCC